VGSRVNRTCQQPTNAEPRVARLFRRASRFSYSLAIGSVSSRKPSQNRAALDTIIDSRAQHLRWISIHAALSVGALTKDRRGSCQYLSRPKQRQRKKCEPKKRRETRSVHLGPVGSKRRLISRTVQERACFGGPITCFATPTLRSYSERTANEHTRGDRRRLSIMGSSRAAKRSSASPTYRTTQCQGKTCRERCPAMTACNHLQQACKFVRCGQVGALKSTRADQNQNETVGASCRSNV
jgi:hypothetical protein